jgi:catechol 2,3-dioxygenase-like lactoylglutathione lyase family enzyme
VPCREIDVALIELNHCFARMKNLEASRRFYCDVLGFRQMPRPDLPFPGHWLGFVGRTQVHMGRDGAPGADRHDLGTNPQSARNNAGVVDHIALLASDPAGFLRRFEASGVPAPKRRFAQMGLFQIFVSDPDGLTIELKRK